MKEKAAVHSPYERDSQRLPLTRASSKTQFLKSCTISRQKVVYFVH